MADATIKMLHSYLTEHDITVSSGGNVKAYSHDHGSGPVLCMVHGYPESSFMWRHVIPLLKDEISMFIPELPGYGISSLPPKPDKHTVGNLILESLQQVFKDRPVIWCGHDRGARVGHRLLVDDESKHNIKASILMDIVPTLEQFRSFARPPAVVAYYHWALLATPSAPQLIEGMGGREFCMNNFTRVKGGNEEGVKRFKEDHAWEIYGHQFNNPECIAGSCADYKSAADTEWKAQEEDQQAGRKIKVPTLVLYSASNLGRMHDVPKIWKEWTDAELESVGIQDGYGHFLPEECPEKVAELVHKFLDKQKL